MRCLLIWPPGGSPASIPGDLLAYAAVLARPGCQVTVRDANLEFFLELLAPGGASSGKNPDAVGVLRSRSFLDPEAYLSAATVTASAMRDERPDRDAGAEFVTRHLRAWVSAADADLVVILRNGPGPLETGTADGRELAALAGVPVQQVGNVTRIVGLGPGAEATADVSGALSGALQELPAGAYLSPGPVISFSLAMGARRAGALVAGLKQRLSPAGFIFCGDAVEDDPRNWFAEGPLAGGDPVPASVSLPIGTELSREVLEAGHQNGVRVLRWQWHDAPGANFPKTLAAATAVGIWNHLTIPPTAGAHPLAEFAARNPNIANSVATLPDDQLPLLGPWATPDVASSGYEGLRPLSGEPFWRRLGDPAHLLLYVAEFGPKRLEHLRVVGTPPRCQPIGSEIDYRFFTPGELSEGQLDEICELVHSGGAVRDRYLRHNLERAHLIALAVESGVIVGCSSLKHPRDEYVERVREKIGLDINGYLERGYTSVRPEYRGLGVGTKLLEGLTSRAVEYPIYSVIREDDPATQTIAIRNRTRKVASFYSELMGKEIGIWMPERQFAGDGDGG